MMISAKATDRSSDILERTMDLYRDLSLALRKTVDALQAAALPGERDGVELDRAIKAHQRSLQSVLELEAGLEKRWKAGGAGVELDLDAARAEIRERLAQWVASR